MPRSHESNEDHAARVDARKAALARASAALTPPPIAEGPPHVYLPAPPLPPRADAKDRAYRLYTEWKEAQR